MRLLGTIDGWLDLERREDRAESGWEGVNFDFIGITAQIRDLDAVNSSDTKWVARLRGAGRVDRFDVPYPAADRFDVSHFHRRIRLHCELWDSRICSSPGSTAPATRGWTGS